MRKNLWRCIIHNKVKGSYGLAVDEEAMKIVFEKKFPLLHLYIFNPPTAVVGYHQDIFTEVNLEACSRLGVHYNRRLTGGGSILMEDGQIGLALIIPQSMISNSSNLNLQFDKLSSGIIAGLSFLGLRARLRPKNDLVVRERKICGIGAYTDENGIILFHASILVDFNFNLMGQVLNIKEAKFKDKFVSQAKEWMTTINDELKNKMNTLKVMEYIIKGYERSFGIQIKKDDFSQDEEERIRSLEKEKYLHKEWIFRGFDNETFSSSAIKKTTGGLIKVDLDLLDGAIERIRISGDFFADNYLIEKLEEELIGAKTREEIFNKVSTILRNNNFYLISQETLTEIILEALQSDNSLKRAKEARPCFYQKKAQNICG